MSEAVDGRERYLGEMREPAIRESRVPRFGEKLYQCIECGSLVSKSTPVCPKCHKLCAGVVCARCHKRLRKEDAFRACRTYDERFYHFECIEPLVRLPPDFKCSDCGQSIVINPRQLLSPNGRLACPHCGALDPLEIRGECRYCLTEVYSAFQRYREIPRLWDGTSSRYHMACRPKFFLIPEQPLKRVGQVVSSLAGRLAQVGCWFWH